jgi:hypothetical protein
MKKMDALWAWACEDPLAGENRLRGRGVGHAHPAAAAMRAQLPARYRYQYLWPLAGPVLGRAMDITLFRASFPAAAGPAGTARAPGVA